MRSLALRDSRKAIPLIPPQYPVVPRYGTGVDLVPFWPPKEGPSKRRIADAGPVNQGRRSIPECISILIKLHNYNGILAIRVIEKVKPV